MTSMQVAIVSVLIASMAGLSGPSGADSGAHPGALSGVGWRAVLLAQADSAQSPPGAATDTALVEVFKPDQSRQCEPDSGTPLAAMVAELAHAGIAVQDSRVAHDGMMRPAVCGAPSGAMNVFSISQGDLAAAQTLGFRPFGQ